METTILLNTIINKLEGSINRQRSNSQDNAVTILPERLSDVIPSTSLPRGFIPKNYLSSLSETLAPINLTNTINSAPSHTYDVKYNAFLMYLVADLTVNNMMDREFINHDVKELFIQYLTFEKDLIENHINACEYIYDKQNKVVLPTNFSQFGGGDKVVIDEAVLASYRLLALSRISDTFRDDPLSDVNSTNSYITIFTDLFRPLADHLIFKITRIFGLTNWNRKISSWEIMMLLISLKRAVDMIDHDDSHNLSDGLVRTKTIRPDKILKDMPDFTLDDTKQIETKTEDHASLFVDPFKPPSRTIKELNSYIASFTSNLSCFVAKQSRDASKKQLKVYLDLATTDDDIIDSIEVSDRNYIIDRCMLIPLIFMKDTEFLTYQLNTNNSYLNTVRQIIKSCEKLYPVDVEYSQSSIGLIGSPIYLDMIMSILTYSRLFKILIPIGLVWNDFSALRQNTVYMINRLNVLMSELKLHDIHYENKMLIGRESSTFTYLLRVSVLHSKLLNDKMVIDYPDTYSLIDMSIGTTEPTDPKDPNTRILTTTNNRTTNTHYNRYGTFGYTDNMFTTNQTSKNIVIDKAFDKTYDKNKFSLKPDFRPNLKPLIISDQDTENSRKKRKLSLIVDTKDDDLVTPKSFVFTFEPNNNNKKDTVDKIQFNRSLNRSLDSVPLLNLSFKNEEDSFSNDMKIDPLPDLLPRLCTVKHCRCKIVLPTEDEDAEASDKLLKEQDQIIGSKKMLTIDDLIALGKTFHCKDRITFKGLCLKKLAELVDPLEEFNKMKGIKEIKQKIVNNILFFTKKGKKNNQILNIAMYGPPGVGKTTICKHIANIYSKAGILKTNKVESVKRSDLVGRYLGETAIKTQEVINKIKGGILLIDEVYSLGHHEKRDSFSKECLDTLTHNLGQDETDFICIVAGYEEDVKNCFFGQNKGLQRRFPFVYKIDNYEDTVMADLMYSKLTSESWTIGSTDKPMLVKFIQENKDKFENFMGDIENFVLRMDIMNNAENPFDAEAKNVTYDLLNKTLADIHNIDPSKKKEPKDEPWRNMYI